MRVPYTVGRWVRDRNHYGRSRLLELLSSSSEPAVWVVGGRRLGKTSLLRQLEWLMVQPGSTHVPLFWDMQGCENSGDLSFELYLALEDARARFGREGIVVEPLAGQDAVVILRRLGQQLAVRGKQLCLLVDEAEVLIEIARREPAWLARLHGELTQGQARTIVASTKLLAQLDQLTAAWESGPLLARFTLLSLWCLDHEAASALVAQRQSGQPVAVAPAVCEAILEQTNRHPYLIQYLCQRLYCEEGPAQAWLRMPQEEDLAPDQLLAGLFAVDFQHMTGLERRLMLAVAAHDGIEEVALLAAVAGEAPECARLLLWGLARLGHLRRVCGQWAVGNEFLRRWLCQAREQLAQLEETPLKDATYARLLRNSQLQEATLLLAALRALEARHASLVAAQDTAQPQAAARLAAEMAEVAGHLAEVRAELQQQEMGISFATGSPWEQRAS